MENSKATEVATSDHSSSDIHIGSDEFVEILTWMSAKQVIKFSSLSKTIHSLISKPSFAKTHCIRSSAIASCAGGVIAQDPDHLQLGEISFHSLPEEDVGIPDKSLSYISRIGRPIMSSSQGLLLLGRSFWSDPWKYEKELLICNPATRRCAPLPRPPWFESGKCNLSFARPHLECHPTNLNSNWAVDYTVIILLLKGDSCCELALYRNGKWEGMYDLLSLGEGRLKPILPDIPVCLFNGGCLVIHYLCDSEACTVVAYEVARKVSSRYFKLPEDWASSHFIFGMGLFKWRLSSSRRETIAIVSMGEPRYTYAEGYTFMVWVLEDYEGGSWTRVFHKTTPEMGVMGKHRVQSFILVMNPMGMSLVFTVRDRVYAYQLDGPQSGRLQLVAEHVYELRNLELIHYINTLRPVCVGEIQPVMF